MSRDRPVSGLLDACEVFREKRAEFVNYRANIAMEFLQRLYDRTPVCERYRRDEAAVHLHLKSSLPVCLRWRRKNWGYMEFFMNFDKPCVPVPVGERLEVLEPIPSVVRLVPLNFCEMYVADSFEVGVPPSLELLWSIFNRKLDALADSTGVLFSKNAHQIIQCVAQAARTLADTYSDVERVEFVNRRFLNEPPTILSQEIGIRMDDAPCEPLHLFACPYEHSLDFVELVQLAANHEARP